MGLDYRFCISYVMGVYIKGLEAYYFGIWLINNESFTMELEESRVNRRESILTERYSETDSAPPPRHAQHVAADQHRVTQTSPLRKLF